MGILEIVASIMSVFESSGIVNAGAGSALTRVYDRIKFIDV